MKSSYYNHIDHCKWQSANFVCERLLIGSCFSLEKGVLSNYTFKLEEACSDKCMNEI